MPKFRYVALDAQGHETTNVMEAESQSRAVAMIRGKGLFPTSVTEVGLTTTTASVKADKQKSQAGLHRDIKLPPFIEDFFAGRVKPKQLMVVTRMLATLLDAGVPLLRGLQILLKQESHPTLRKALSTVQESVEGGSTFAEALGQQPRVFVSFYINMVKAGEAGGVLEQVLRRLAEHMEKSERLKSKIKSAMVYPLVVLIVAVCILVFLIVKIVPEFAKMFTGMLGGEAQLPWLTQQVMGLSKTFLTRSPYIIGSIISIVVAIRLIGQTRRGRYAIDSIKLRLPVFGNLLRLTAVAHFSRTLGTLLTSGVPILQALTIVRDTVGNDVVSRAVSKVHESVKEGESMAAPMTESRAFPIMAVSMVEVGEETGALPEMLGKVAETYENEVDNAVAAMTSIIEPIMILMLAGVVGTIVISMFLPIVSLVTQMGK
ncbi:MAG: type II secretion system F family protein [bacterium]